MNKREKIIVLIAVLIGVYGLVDYLFFSGGKAYTLKAEQVIQKNQIDGFASLSGTNLLMVEAAIKRIDPPFLMERIESEWKNDPFDIVNPPVVKNEKTEEVGQDIPEMIYSGFIQVGNQFMAVINGMEYMAGETIKDVGFKIRQIMPGKVVLQTRSKREVIIFLEEN